MTKNENAKKKQNYNFILVLFQNGEADDVAALFGNQKEEEMKRQNIVVDWSSC
jgi:hypothetical protein